MPTFDTTNRFLRDFDGLQPGQQAAFRRAVRAMVEDLNTGAFRRSLRVTRVQGTSEVWELTWAPNGRATWQYGAEVRPGEPHIIWRRVGTHDIFTHP